MSILDAKSFTAGAYIQHTWDISDKVKLENGLRIDNVTYSNTNFSKNQTFVLPKVSALFKINNNWSSRIGGGLGYKIPTIFTERTETFQYQNLSALNNVEAERSIGGTADVNYRGGFSDDLLFSINQMFFITQLNKPLVLEQNGANFSFLNTKEPITSNGFGNKYQVYLQRKFKIIYWLYFTNANAKYLRQSIFTIST
ncbi:MAG: TonB-dependent receptor [Saprospiraceae bacterium]|nr:TonB-dependent receptor [Saprospiraceae bacterium]